MKLPLIYLGLLLVFALVMLMVMGGIILVVIAFRGQFMPTWLAGLILGALLLATVLLPAALITRVYRQSKSGQPGSRGHRRYLRRLATRFRRHPLDLPGDLPRDDAALIEAAYQQVDQESQALIISTAEAVFFHTAISQSGHMDALVTLNTQLRLLRQLARRYHPRPGLRVLVPLIMTVGRSALSPSRREEVDLGSQIGPAIIGASVVGAIPGANLVSLIIADAVIQGSANALATIRLGLLAQRYFYHRREGSAFDPERVRGAVNLAARELLSQLVSGASGVLSKEIWDAAKDNLRRMPAATYDSLKSLVAKSVRGLSRKKDEEGEANPSDPGHSTD
ncbi:MAG: DUF697 domain-containing protein [Fidelibacterota bacterium]|nr:MAG: DUF697 domain-containing protein [Candidatus Neomarinimicrobiota bacterium]